MSRYRNIYMLGVGGIGMSALARFYAAHGARVAGYDRSLTPLTGRLIEEGIAVSTVMSVDAVPEWVTAQDTLVVYTPAVRQDHPQLNYFKDSGFKILKRAEALAEIVNERELVAVAGTHGKTTTSTMVAHLLLETGYGCSAFLGGIAVNYDTNTLIDDDSDTVVVEADEYDRSFLRLEPTISIITSVDPDHLDIYGSGDDMLDGFKRFAEKLKPSGRLILRHGVEEKLSVKGLTYGVDADADVSARNIRVEDGNFVFDVSGKYELKDCVLPMPGRHNVENALAAMIVAMELGVVPERVKDALSTFKGVKRRFEFHIKTDEMVYIDDYAHHPAELEACINAVKEVYPGKKVTGVFQPHLYSRTRDFADGFARALEGLNHVVLLDIYPAREEPIEGVDSQMLLDKIDLPEKNLVKKEDLIGFLKERELEVLLTLGAGDIDQLVEPLTKELNA